MIAQKQVVQSERPIEKQQSCILPGALIIASAASTCVRPTDRPAGYFILLFAHACKTCLWSSSGASTRSIILPRAARDSISARSLLFSRRRCRRRPTQWLRSKRESDDARRNLLGATPRANRVAAAHLPSPTTPISPLVTARAVQLVGYDCDTRHKIHIVARFVFAKVSRVGEQCSFPSSYWNT